MSTGTIHHIELYVSDLNVSMNFWEWFLEGLGYTRFQSWENGRSFKLGEMYLVFVQVEERFKDKTYHRCGVGLNHLAFRARSREHVDAVTKSERYQFFIKIDIHMQVETHIMLFTLKIQIELRSN